MNQSNANDGAAGALDHDDFMSALFASMVLQQTNLAMMFLGRTPHPQTGQTIRDVEGAKVFIDQLEMLEFKTRGNLTKEEERLLKQSLMTLRLAYVEAAESPEARPASATPQAGKAPVAAKPAATAQPESREAASPPQPATEEEPHKKFVKKY